MHKQHTIEIPVAIRNLGADMLGSEHNHKLPPGFALELMMVMLRLDAAGAEKLRQKVCEEGWTRVLIDDPEVARFKLADSYCCAACDILDRV